MLIATRDDFPVRVTVTRLGNNNNNENFPKLTYSTCHAAYATTRRDAWPPAGFGTAQTHHTPSPGPPEAVREPPTAPYGCYTHSSA